MNIKRRSPVTMNFLKNKIFKMVSEEAALSGVRAFVIGGFVRDSLLGRDSKDIDIVVEGSGIELAEKVAKRLNVNVTIFKSFGTAMLRSGSIEVEFVGARKESYRADSRKPIVEDGTLEEDQKTYNRLVSRYRIVVEHSLAQMNRFQVLSQVYRHSRQGHGSLVRIVAGLVNRSIDRRPLKSYPCLG